MLCAAGRAAVMPAVFSPWNCRDLVESFVMWKLYNSGKKIYAEIAKIGGIHGIMDVRLICRRRRVLK